MSSGGYYYDPVTNWKVDWSNVNYYKKQFKTNCMSRYIDRGLKKQMIDSMNLDLQMMELSIQSRITEKINNKLSTETDILCNQLSQLQLEYEEIKNMLNDE